MATTVRHIDSATFDQVDGADLALVDFFAPWCGPCRQQSPILDAVAAAVADDVVIAKVDVDQAPDIAVRCNVSSVPTLLVMRKGKEERRYIGVQSKQELIAALG